MSSLRSFMFSPGHVIQNIRPRYSHAPTCVGSSPAQESEVEVKLRSAEPQFKPRLRSGVNLWCVAAILGLLGTWISGTTVEMAGNLWDHQLRIVVTPMTGIITLAWLGIVVWWYKDRASRRSQYKAAAAGHPDVLFLDEFGVTWGVDNIAVTKIAWTAVASYRIKSRKLELALPSGTLTVDIGELDRDIDPLELAAFLQSQGVRNAS